MVNKKLLNKQVIKAISIGLSAAMALTPAMSVPVYAEETNADPNTTNESQTQQPTPLQQAQTQVQGAQAAAENAAQDAVDATAPQDTSKAPSNDSSSTQSPILKADPNEIKEVPDSTTGKSSLPASEVSGIPTVDDATGKTADDAQSYVDSGVLKNDDPVVDQALKLDDITATDNLKEGSVDENNNPVSNVQDGLSNAKDAAKEIAGAIGDKDQKTQDAEGVAKQVNDDMDKASGDLQDKIDTINNATDPDAANQAYNEGVDIISGAVETFNNAEKTYNGINDELIKINKLIVDKSKEYEEILLQTGKDAEQSKEDLAGLKKKAAELEEAAKKAGEKVAESAAYEIINSQIECNNADQIDWGKQDMHFKYIMKGFFVPQVLGGTVDKISDIEVVKGMTIYNENKEDLKDNDHYIKVKYTDANGVVQTEYYNYKLDGRSLIMFKKEKVAGNTYYSQIEHFEYKIENEKGKEETKTLKADDVKNSATQTGISNTDNLEWGDDNDKYVSDEKNDNTSYYMKEGNGTLDSKVSAGITRDEENKTTTNITIDENSKKATLAVDQEGNIVKTVTGDVTTITLMEGVELGEDGNRDGFLSKTEADDAAKAEIAKLVENKEIEMKMGENGLEPVYQFTSEEYTAQVDATQYSADAKLVYTTSFTTTIDLTGIKKTYDDDDNDERIDANEMSLGKGKIIDDVINDIAQYLKNKDYYLDSYSVSDDYSVSGKESDDGFWFVHDWNNTFTVNQGTLSVTYSKLETVDITEWWNRKYWTANFPKYAVENFNNKMQPNNPDSAYAGSKAIYGTGWNGVEAYSGTVYYIKGYTATGSASETTTQDDVNTSAEGKALQTAQGNADSMINQNIAAGIQKEVNWNSKKEVTTVANVVKNENPNLTKTVVGTPETVKVDKEFWKYSGTYTSRTERKVEAEPIYTATWKATKLTHVEDKKIEEDGYYSNKFYDDYMKNGSTDGIILIEKTDKDYNNFLDSAKNQKAAYEQLQIDAGIAQASITRAQRKVNTLIEKLNELQGFSGSASEWLDLERKDLELQLEKAKEELEAAKDKKEEIINKMEDLKKVIDDKIAELTPEEVPSGETGGTTTGGTTTGGTTTAGIPTLLAAGAGDLFAGGGLLIGTDAPIAGEGLADVGEGLADAGDGLVEDEFEIDDSLVPMADGSELEETEDEVEIKDQETPKSNFDSLEEEKANMNWWWLLVIAAFGAAGWAMYRKYQQNKEKQLSANSTKENDK